MHILKLPKNIYGKSQGYMLWTQHLAKVIEEMLFHSKG